MDLINNYSIDLRTVKTFIEPTVVLLSTKVDDAIINCFDPDANTGGSPSDDNDQFRLPYLLEVRPPIEFDYNTAKTKLVSLQLDEGASERVIFNVPGELLQVGESVEDGAGHQGQLLRLAGRIDVESRTTVCISTTRATDISDWNSDWLFRRTSFIFAA
jgi:DNA mismatch repair protein MSH5